MQRRKFLKGGTAICTFSAWSGLIAPLSIERALAQSRVAEGVELAKALAELGKEVAGLAKEIVQAVELYGHRILSRLNTISLKLDNLQRNIGLVVEEELDKHDLKVLVRKISAKELSIIQTIQAMNAGQVTDANLVLKEAFEQRDLRNELVTAQFGASVYPFVARSFISESIVYFALGNQAGNFQKSKEVVCELLRKYADAYTDASWRIQESYNNHKKKWDNLAQPIYLGSTTSMFSCYAYYLEYPNSTLESAERLHTRLRKRECTSNDLNPRGLPKSSLLGYSNDGVFKEDTIYDRREAIMQVMRDLKMKGYGTKRLSDEINMHLSSSRQVYGAVEELFYPTDMTKKT